METKGNQMRSSFQNYLHLQFFVPPGFTLFFRFLIGKKFVRFCLFVNWGFIIPGEVGFFTFVTYVTYVTYVTCFTYVLYVTYVTYVIPGEVGFLSHMSLLPTYLPRLGTGVGSHAKYIYHQWKIYEAKTNVLNWRICL